MFSKKYRGYAVVGLILISWLALVDWRNLNNPRVQHITVERAGTSSVVRCDVWNPRYEEVGVAVLVRLTNPGEPSSGRPASASPYNVIKSRIAPRSSLAVHETIKAFGAWPDAEVRAYLITDPIEIEKIAAAQPFVRPVGE